jgi:hypothetical protein
VDIPSSSGFRYIASIIRVISKVQKFDSTTGLFNSCATICEQRAILIVIRINITVATRAHKFINSSDSEKNIPPITEKAKANPEVDRGIFFTNSTTFLNFE